MDVDTDQITEALRAAGEPTRLRILSLLRRGDLAVGELVQVLGQSQPRLSHHLKTLSSAGLVERLPEGSWVFYRAQAHHWAGRLLNTIFSEIDTSAGEFARDAKALKQVRETRAAAAEAYFTNIADDWDHLRGLHFPNAAIEQALLDIVAQRRFRRVIDLGTGTGRMLTLFAPHCEAAEGLDMSHQMLTVARANLQRAAVDNAKVRQGDVCNTPFESNSADLVIIHQVLHFIEDPARVLLEAARILSPDGLLLIVDFAPHSLEYLRDEQGHRRLGIRHEDMSDWAGQAGLKLDPARQFDPPETLEQGLGVNVWRAAPKTQSKEAAA